MFIQPPPRVHAAALCEPHNTKVQQTHATNCRHAITPFYTPVEHAERAHILPLLVLVKGTVAAAQGAQQVSSIRLPTAASTTDGWRAHSGSRAQR